MRDGRWGEVFPSRKTAGGAQEGQVWERHLAFLKEHVPPEKLVFFDVRDGWEPLVSNSRSPLPHTSLPRRKVSLRARIMPAKF